VVLPDVDDLAEAWQSMAVIDRAAVVRAVIGDIVIAPAVRGRNRWDDDRVAVTWKV
jgi:hypothetical protein